MKTIKTLLFSLLLAGCAPPRAPLPPTPTPSPSARPTPPTLEGQLRALENPGSLADFGISLRPSRDRLPLGERFTLELYSSREAYWHLYLFQSSGAVLTLLTAVSPIVPLTCLVSVLIGYVVTDGLEDAVRYSVAVVPVPIVATAVTVQFFNIHRLAATPWPTEQ